MRTKQEKRLTQENLGKMTEEARNALIGKRARDYSENEFGIVSITNIDLARRSKIYYEVIFTSDVGCGRYKYSGHMTQNLELIN